MEIHGIHPPGVISERVSMPRTGAYGRAVSESSPRNPILGMISAGRPPEAAYKCSPKLRRGMCF